MQPPVLRPSTSAAAAAVMRRGFRCFNTARAGAGAGVAPAQCTTTAAAAAATTTITPLQLHPAPSPSQSRFQHHYHHQKRWSSHSPLSSPANSPPARPKITIQTLQGMRNRGEPIAVLTAHDFASAHVADTAGMDLILVGDSLAMVAMGMEDTSEVSVDDMLLHCRSVARATRSAFTVGDLPMGSYEISPEQGLATAIQFVKQGRMKGIKLEGGREFAPTVRRIVDAGIPVLGHVGLTPQRQNALGGFKVQGKDAASAARVLDDALAIQEAGAFAMVLEAVPGPVAELVTARLRVPTIGIGAGAGCSGQVLVQIDMTGNFPPGRFIPKFVRQYGNVWEESRRAIEAYRDDVKSRQYPAPEHTYTIKEGPLGEFVKMLELAEQGRDGERQ